MTTYQTKNNFPPAGGVLTPEELKNLFIAHGVTFKKWADDNGYGFKHVYFVVNGQLKGKYGLSHEIAVKLRLVANPNTAQQAA